MKPPTEWMASVVKSGSRDYLKARGCLESVVLSFKEVTYPIQLMSTLSRLAQVSVQRAAWGLGEGGGKVEWDGIFLGGGGQNQRQMRWRILYPGSPKCTSNVSGMGLYSG